VYWVEHYRGLRKDLRNCFDSMFSPKNIMFKIWTSRYLNWSREEVDRSSEQSSGRPINAQQMADIGNKGSTTGLLEVYSEEEKFQRILDFFTLGGIDTELYDEEYLDGKHYWKETAKAHNQEWEDDIESESLEDKRKDSIPDRIQHFRRQHRNIVQEKLKESWDPMSPGSMNPTSVKSLDLHFTKQADTAQAGPVTVKKGGFGTVQGNTQVRGDVYDYAGWTSTAGSALNRGARKDDLQELLEGDEWKSPLDF
jgi:hypothetical protein